MKKVVKTLLILVVLAIISVVYWKNQDTILKFIEDKRIEYAANKTMTDLKESRESFGEEYTDRNNFEDILISTFPNKGNFYGLDGVRTGEEEYNNYVFRRYTGIQDRDRVTYVSARGPSWEEVVPNETWGDYPKEKFYAILVLANSEEDAEIILGQMKENIKPWEWKPEDTVPDGETSGLLIDIPYGDHIEITENDLHFIRNGNYVLFAIIDENAILEGTMESPEYYQQLFNESVRIAQELQQDM